MAKWLVIVGIVLVILGLLWPWITKLGLGHLPGDIHIKRDHFDFYFPLATSILISLAVTLILWVLRK
jgi:H+/Cl- antiporter ClcA